MSCFEYSIPISLLYNASINVSMLSFLCIIDTNEGLFNFFIKGLVEGRLVTPRVGLGALSALLRYIFTTNNCIVTCFVGIFVRAVDMISTTLCVVIAVLWYWLCSNKLS